MAVDRIAGIAVKASDRNPEMIVKAETITGRVMNLSASSIGDRETEGRRDGETERRGDEETGRFKPSMSPCPPVSPSLCLSVSLSLCLSVSLSPLEEIPI